MATRRGDAAQIPIRVATEGIRDDLKALKKTLESSMTELNQALEIGKKAYEVVAKGAKLVADELERGVKAALKLEGPSSLFGRRLKDADDAVRHLHEGIGQAVTKSEAWNSMLSQGTEFINVMADFFRSSEAKEWVDELGRGIAGVMSGFINALLGARSLYLSTWGGGLNIEDKRENLAAAKKQWSIQIDTDRKGSNKVAIDYLEKKIVELENDIATFGRSQKFVEGLQNFADRLAATSAGKGPAGAPKSRTAIGTQTGKEEEPFAVRADEDVVGTIRGERKDEYDRLRMIDDLKQRELKAKAKWDAETKRIEQRGIDEQRELNNEKIREQERTKDALIASIKELGVGMVSGGIEAAAAAVGAGENVLESLKNFAGGMIMTVGKMLIQFGTAALLGAALGAAVPFLAPFTGTSAGAGLAMLAGGALMVGVGAAMSKSGGDGGSSSTSYATGYAGGSVSSAPSSYGISTVASSAPTTRITNVYMTGAVVANSPSEAGRTVKTWLKAAEARGY